MKKIFDVKVGEWAGTMWRDKGDVVIRIPLLSDGMIYTAFGRGPRIIISPSKSEAKK